MLQITKDEVIARLRAACAESTQDRWARRHGVTPQYVSDVLRGRKDPGASILAGLGLVRIERYVSGSPEARS